VTITGRTIIKWYLSRIHTRLTLFCPTGSFQYSHAVGRTSVDKTDTSNAKDIQEDAVFLLASQTKLLTAFAAMLVVERGLIGLDDDVTGLLPELGEQKVLVGFEDDGKGGERAVLEEREGAITLRYFEDSDGMYR
jgi:CubicO group peptidase (beta-lactamase class C family)